MKKAITFCRDASENVIWGHKTVIYSQFYIQYVHFGNNVGAKIPSVNHNPVKPSQTLLPATENKAVMKENSSQTFDPDLIKMLQM